MNEHDKNIEQLGQMIRDARSEAGLSSYALAARLRDVHRSTISRIESGQISRPSPELLKRIAEQLDLDHADLFTLAGYPLPEALPDFDIYLRARHGQLPEHAMTQLNSYFELLRDKYGPTSGPDPGEDEHDTAA